MTTPPDPGWDYLLTEAGLTALSQIQRAAQGGEPLTAIGLRLRAEGEPPDRVAALLTETTLRESARKKFGNLAAGMLLTRSGLEQATRLSVATIHAERFGASGILSVSDLGCGIGADSIAFRQAGLTVRAVERDPLTAAMARHNLGLIESTSSFEVLVGDAERIGPGASVGLFFDPARRTSGHRETVRLTSPDNYSPPLSMVFAAAASHPTGVKLGPGFDRSLIPPDAEAQWVSVGGEVVEMVLWFGRLARARTRRSALLLTNDGTHELSAPADAPNAPVRVRGEYLYEPDGAVIRARLIGQLAERLGAGMLSDGIAYLTTDSYSPTPFARAFRILEEVPVKERDLRRALAGREIGTLEIKKRGIAVVPSALRKRLKLQGPRSATLILTREQGAHVGYLAERLP